MQIYNSTRERLDKFYGTLSRYSTILKLVAADSVWRFKKESFIILITSFFGVFFQAGTIGLAVYYAQALQKGSTIKLLGLVFETRSSIGLLFLCGAGVLFSLLLSAWLIYFSRMKGFVLRRRYEEFCSERVLSLFGSSLKVWSPSEKDSCDSSLIFGLARKDARYIGRVLWMILDTIIPIITLMIAIGILFYSNAPLTFLMLFIFGVSSVFQYRISVSGAKNSSLREKYSKGATLEYLQVILRLKGTSVPLPESKSWIKEKFFASGKIKQYMDAYVGRLKAVENSQLVSNILYAVTIFVIILVSGGGIILKGEGWGNLVVYLVALRFGLVNMKQSSRKITGINRFYPQVKRYFQFLENTRLPLRLEGSQQINYVIPVSNNFIENSMPSYSPHKGNRISLISTIELNRYTLSSLFDCLLGHSELAVRNALGSMWFVTSKYSYLSGTLRESLSLPLTYSWQDFHKEMEDAGLWNKVEGQLPHNLDEHISIDAWDRLDIEIRHSLILLNAIHSNYEWIVIEENVLRLLPETSRNFFLNRLSDSILVIVFYGDTMAIGSYCEDIVAVIENGNIAGLGNVEWFMQNQSKIKEILDKMLVKDLHKGRIDLDSDDEFDDEDL